MDHLLSMEKEFLLRCEATIKIIFTFEGIISQISIYQKVP